MAISETIIWTAVPNGLTAPDANGTRKLQVSVHVGPTLAGGPTGTLADYANWVDWPATVAGQPLSFDLRILSGGGLVGNTTVAADTAPLRSDLWKALFGPASGISVGVRDPGEPFTDLPVVSYPSAHIADWLETHYTDWAVTTPTEFPSFGDLRQTVGELGVVGPDGQKRYEAILAGLKAERDAVNGGKKKRGNDFSGVTDVQAFAALRNYHQPRASAFKVTAPKVDFHRALSFAGEHRTLQRALGLVFDLTVPLPRSFSSNMHVVLIPSYFTRAAYTPVLPRTQATISPTVFEAKSAGGQIVGRQLTVGDGSVFNVHQIDVDGGGLKTAIFADNLVMSRSPQPQQRPAPDAPDSYAPPSLRSNGLVVTAVGRGLGFVSKLDRSEALMKGMPNSVPDLTAEDLVRGYVLDVHDATGNAWNSTARRVGTYQAPGLTGPAPVADDEAATDAPPRMASDASDPKQINLPENLIRWDGWSLAGPRPGVPIKDDGKVGPGGIDPGPFGQLKMALTPKPGTLPRLRFGETYAVRMRIVDIAGNALPAASAANVGDALKRVSPPAIYARHDPIASPDVHHHDASVPGESLRRLVIRGNYDVDATEQTPRTFAPTRAAERLAEQHGKFDAKANGLVTLAKSAYALIAGRVDKRYPATGPISLTDPVPYLPDPLAKGAVLTLLDGPLARQRLAFDFSPASGGAWPDFRPFRVLLAGGAAPEAHVDASARTVDVTLGKADVLRARLSSTIDPADLQALGIYGWVTKHFGGAVPATLRQAALDGQHWTMTPYEEIEFVYAVRQPLRVPQFNTVSPSREIGWTYANVRGSLQLSRKSTSKIDVLAHFNEPVDAGPGMPPPSGPGAPDVAGREVDGLAFTFPLDRKGDDGGESFVGRHEFFDTKHRVVTYRARATSRFTEHYAGHLELAVPAPGTPVALSSIGLEPGSVRVVTKVGNTVYAEGTAFVVDSTAGSITFVPPGPAPGTTVEVDFLPPVSRPMPAAFHQTKPIPSSARPASPQIRFVVPIYDWDGPTKSGNKVRSGRSPSALRVFMERPWWTSGVGELLGVVTWPGAEGGPAFVPLATTVPKESQLYVSDWGADPVFGGAALPSAHPRLASFPNSPVGARATGLTIDERNDVRVNVAGHPVAYDAERELWYCDVRVDTGKAYTPMIRLALARYQPNSLNGCELSRVVLADVMAIEPGRSVVVTRQNRTLLSSVTVSGYSYAKAANVKGSGPGVAQIIVERRDKTVKDEVLGWKAVGKPIPMAHQTFKNGLTTWTARRVAIPPGGTHRLFIEQYEVVPTEHRDHALYRVLGQAKAFRLLYQDLVPL